MPNLFFWLYPSFIYRDTQSVLAYTKGLSIKLQGPYVDVARAHHEIETVKATLEETCSNVEAYHTRIYAQATAMAQCWDR